MTILDLVYYPDTRLQQTCEPVTEFNSELHTLLDNMFETMYASEGIGLAAPQIGILKQITVIDISHDGSYKLELINPEIIESSGKATGEEGCLSIPGYRENVTRPEIITVRALDRNGDEFEIKAGDILSVCMQHEIDHLNGTLFIDRISRLKRELFKRWYKKNGPFTGS